MNYHTPTPWMVEPINGSQTVQITTTEATGFQVICETAVDNSPERQATDAAHIILTANCFDEMQAALIAAQRWFGGYGKLTEGAVKDMIAKAVAHSHGKEA